MKTYANAQERMKQGSQKRIVVYQKSRRSTIQAIMRPGKTAKKRKTEDRRKWEHAKMDSR